MGQFTECRYGSIRAQLQVSELKLQTATLHAYGVAEELDRSAAEGRQLSYADRTRFKAMCCYAAQHVIDAIHVLMNLYGTDSFAESCPMQRCWPDANTAARHAGLNVGVALEVFGKSLFGVPGQITPLV